jgi:hypothetical protein
MPPWHDPLLPPPQPTATAAGAYIEQPEPRPNPYTVEGEIFMIGQFARGAVRAKGPHGLLARAVILLFVAGSLIGLVASAVSLFVR